MAALRGETLYRCPACGEHYPLFAGRCEHCGVLNDLPGAVRRRALEERRPCEDGELRCHASNGWCPRLPETVVVEADGPHLACGGHAAERMGWMKVALPDELPEALLKVWLKGEAGRQRKLEKQVLALRELIAQSSQREGQARTQLLALKRREEERNQAVLFDEGEVLDGDGSGRGSPQRAQRSAEGDPGKEPGQSPGV